MNVERTAMTIALSVCLVPAGVAQETSAEPTRAAEYSASSFDFITPESFFQPASHVGAFSSCGTDSCGNDDSGASGCGDPCGEGCNSSEESCGCLDGSLFSGLKNRKCGFCDDITYSVGGALRYRYMDEKNRLRPGVPATGARTTYNLWRFTPNVSVSWNDIVTGYVEAIDASAFGYDAPLTPVPIDQNRSDLLRYYAEFNLGEIGDGKLKYRYGRQFLQYGSQHLLSPLAWSNTFRNFEGHKFVYSTDDWSVDAFSMGSVNGAAGGSGYGPQSFDTVDSDRRISGVYSSYSGLENNTVDLYWLWSDEANRSAALQDGDRHTIGLRLAGTKPVKDGKTVVGTWDWDLEGAYQFGEDNFGAAVNEDVRAGFASALGGYTFDSMPWSPSVGGIFYWGSGDDNPADGVNNTFYSMYPLGHAYWGLIDNFSGQNLIDYGIKGSVKPTKKVTLTGTFHWFDRAKENDAVYNIVGAPLSAGVPGKKIGNEFDVVANYNATEALSVQAGYFWFWYDEAITNGAATRPDAGQFYLMSTLKY